MAEIGGESPFWFYRRPTALTTTSRCSANSVCIRSMIEARGSGSRQEATAIINLLRGSGHDLP